MVQLLGPDFVNLKSELISLRWVNASIPTYWLYLDPRVRIPWKQQAYLALTGHNDDQFILSALFILNILMRSCKWGYYLIHLTFKYLDFEYHKVV